MLVAAGSADVDGKLVQSVRDFEVRKSRAVDWTPAR